MAEHRDSPNNAATDRSLKVAFKHRRSRGLGGWRRHYYYAEENEPASAALLIEAYVKELRDGAAAEIRAIVSPCL